MRDVGDLGDWIRSPNISGNPDTYELENEALARDGRLDRKLYELAPWDGCRLVDIGCGTGFWLPRYAERVAHVVGVEPDPELLAVAEDRVEGNETIDIRPGSAEHLPIEDEWADVVHARFAYFFGSESDQGLTEVARVLAPGGVFIAIDNSWAGGDFARLLRSATGGNASVDPDATDRWWSERGAVRHELHGGWIARSGEELARILRIEFPHEIVDRFVAGRRSSSISYRFALYEWRKPHQSQTQMRMDRRSRAK